MIDRVLFCFALAVICILALPAFAAPDHGATIKRVEQSVIQPGYQTLLDRATTLNQTINAYCRGQKSDDGDVRHAFQSMMDAWQTVQHIRHGPIATMDRHARIQFWPDKRAKTGKHLRKFMSSGSTEDLTPDVFAGKSVAVQGLQALERLVFADFRLAHTPLTDQTLASCDVAIAIAHNIVAIAEKVVAEIHRSDENADAKMELRDHVSDLITGLEVISRLKLLAPVGEARPRPRLAENWRAGQSLRNIATNLHALRALYMALAGPELNDDPESNLISHQFDEAIKTTRGLDDEIGPVLESENGPTQLRALALSLQDLRELVIVKLTSHLGIRLGFNSLDGD